MIKFKCQFKCWKYCFHNFFQHLQNFSGVAAPPNSLPGTNQICSLANVDFFTSVIGLDILIKLFKANIMVLVWAIWALLNFYLKQKEWFPVWKFTVWKEHWN